MFVPPHQISLTGILLTFVASGFVAEFAGYWLHRLLHSDKIPSLSQSHLIHHFLMYGPDQTMRHEKYHDATGERFSIGNVGLEWLAPCAVILFVCWGVLLLLTGVPRTYQVLSLATLVGWPVFMFSYLHDRMHLKNFWMTRVPVLRVWFCNARRLHDIHHRVLNNEGRMNANFGIGFFLFDRLFGTIGKRHQPFNWAGLRVAISRYGLLDRGGRLEPKTDSQIHTEMQKAVSR